MTRAEFFEQVVDADSLFDFCNEHNYREFLDEYVLQGDLDSAIFDDIDDARSSKMWYEVRDYLNNVDRDYDMYRHNGMLDFGGLCDDEIDDLIQDLANKLDDDEFFDTAYDDDEDEDEDDEYDDGDDDEVPEWDRVCPVPQAETPQVQSLSEDMTQFIQVLLG